VVEGDPRDGNTRGLKGVPTFHPSPEVDIHYRVDDFTSPWRKPETVLLLHGNAESSLAWYAWIPNLARDFLVVRPDIRGHGESTPMPRDFPWTLDILIDDFVGVMDELEVERVHLVGAKLGATVARAFAARRADRVNTLTVLGAPPPFRKDAAARVPAWTAEFEKDGLENWARRGQAARLGSAFPPEGAQWWTAYMARMAVSTQIGWIATIACADIRADIPRIACPTLVITTQGSGLSSVEETREWQQAIPNSNLLVLPGDSYHVAVSDAERCAQATHEFISQAARAVPRDRDAKIADK
jgi:3-oxoadipate enol-lactonase